MVLGKVVVVLDGIKGVFTVDVVGRNIRSCGTKQGREVTGFEIKITECGVLPRDGLKQVHGIFFRTITDER